MRNGFSLVELSIVLVILGLLAGGVLTGQSLIRAAELRSVTTEFSRYQAAVNTFRDKYFALPGDMPNATAFWGAAHATPATCITTASPDNRATCNGNGDGSINVLTFYAPDGYERFHFWLQLANAGLIEGAFSGVTATAGSFAWTPGLNVPKSRLSSYYWDASSVRIGLANTATSAEWFPRPFDYSVALSFRSNAANSLTPGELWNIDTKIDDGKPALGQVYTFRASGSWAPSCATADNLAAEYAVSATSAICFFQASF